MIKDISNLMKEKLSDLYHPTTGVITALAGLTRVREVALGEDKKNLRKIPYPVDGLIEDVPDDCPQVEKLYLLVPDTPSKTDAKRCIVYFEGGKVTPVQNAQGFNQYTTTITLIAWFDTRQFQPQQNLTTSLLTLFKKKIDTDYSLNPQSVLSQLSIVTATPNDSDPSIFQKYTYSDFVRPYLGFPFGYFKIEFNINFQINENCAQIPTINSLNLCN